MSGILWGGPAMMESDSAGLVNITGGSAFGFRFSFEGTEAFAGWQFASGGQLNRLQNTVSSLIPAEWWTNQPDVNAGPAYEIRATLLSGVTPTGPTLGTWINLVVARQWSLTQPTVGAQGCSLSISIRDVATQTIQDTATYNIDVALEP